MIGSTWSRRCIGGLARMYHFNKMYQLASVLSSQSNSSHVSPQIPATLSPLNQDTISQDKKRQVLYYPDRIRKPLIVITEQSARVIRIQRKRPIHLPAPYSCSAAPLLVSCRHLLEGCQILTCSTSNFVRSGPQELKPKRTGDNPGIV